MAVIITVVAVLLSLNLIPFPFSAHTTVVAPCLFVGLFEYCLTLPVTHILSSMRAKSVSVLLTSSSPEPKTGCGCIHVIKVE